MSSPVAGDAGARAKEYSRQKYGLAVVETVFLLGLLFFFSWSGFSSRLAHAASFAYLVIVYLIYWVLELPLAYYRGYVLEQRFGLSNQTRRGWLGDQCKAGVVSCAVLVALFAGFFRIVRIFPGSWWVVVSCLWIFISLILARLLPVVIIPIFFKYTPLTDEALRNRIRGLAETIGVKILDVFEIDFSRKTLKANAALVGWGATRRVILADTLKDRYTHDEIAMILAHEFAHYKLGHLPGKIALNAVWTLGSFYVIFRTGGVVLPFFNLVSFGELAAFPVVYLYLTVLGAILQPVSNAVSRSFETSADRMALRVDGHREAFVSMMQKLADQNLSDRTPHPLIKILFFDHPPVSERIALAQSR